MANTIQCPDCEGTVSLRASQCPHCGAPVNQPEGGKPVQVIEQTSKKWKGMQVIGFVALLVGIMLMVSGINAESAGSTAFGFLFVLGGLVLLIAGRLGAWWYHK